MIKFNSYLICRNAPRGVKIYIMKKFVPQSNIPKMATVKQFEQEQKRTVETESNQSFSHKKIEFAKPTIISFVGIPGSGKSTITKQLANILNSCSYLEPEESEYPDDVKEKFSRIKEPGAALDVYKYFRDTRVESLLKAEREKREGKSSVLDCFYDKIMVDVLGKPGTD